MFRLPALQYLHEQMLQACKRFPVAIVYSLINCVLAILLNHKIIEGHIYESLMISVGIGIFLALGLKLFGEAHSQRPRIAHLWEALSITLVLMIHFAFESRNDGWSCFQYFEIGFASVLFVTIAPFVSVRTPQQFWAFNKALVIRLFTAAVFSYVLNFGVWAILFTIDHLLGINVKINFYFDSFLISQFGIIVWFFLAGVPVNPRQLTISFLKVLKILVQYLLIPLISIYYLILYLYMGKIALAWQLPKGMVSSLVCAASLSGILSLLLVYPIKDQEQHIWLKRYTKHFYYALIPLVGLMLLGLKQRVWDYGLTEERCLLIAYAFWLLGIAIYFSLSKTANIIFIPLTLALLTFVTAVGPVNASRFSMHSQHQRLIRIIERNGMLVSSRAPLQKPAKELLFQDMKDLSSIFDYLIGRHGFKSVEMWVSTDTREQIKRKFPEQSTIWYNQAYNITPTIMQSLGLRYVSRWEATESDQEHFNFQVDAVGDTTRVVETRNYAFMLRDINAWKNKGAYTVGDLSVKVNFKDESQLTLTRSKDNHTLLRINLIDFARQLSQKHPGAQMQYLKPSELEWAVRQGDLSAKVVFTNLMGSLKTGAEKVYGFQADILVAIAKPN